MKKNRLSILIIFMTLSLVGIVTVQIIWIRHAIAIQEEQFDAKVNKVMTESAEKIETLDYVHFFAHGDVPVPPPPPPPVPTEEYIDSIVKFIKVKIPDSFRSFDILPLSKPNSSRVISINGDQIIVENSDSVNKIFFHNKNAHDQNFEELQIELDASELADVVHFDHRIEIDNEEERHVIIERIKGKEKKINWVARKMVDEILVRDEDRIIPFERLTESLNNGFQENNIETNIHIALIQNDSISKSSDTITDSSTFLTSPYQTQLYPNDIFLKDAFLSVVFPDKRSFLYKSMTGLLLASLIFSLFVLTAFWLSIHFILKQKRISEVKSDFINNMTHEFKTPIATIGVAVDTLTNEKVIANKDMLKEYAGIIKSENQRMNGHVEKILSVARMDRQESEFNFEVVNVHSLLEELSETFKLRTDAREGKLYVNLNAVNSYISADSGHLYNALQNVLDNADKYSPDAPSIEITTSSEQQYLIITISDTGMGMSRHVQAKIFDTFYRQPTGNIHNIKGFGLGLSYVKTVIDMHKGRIEVSSKPNEGSSFKIYLPYSHG